jgi:hypothetical protein
MPWTSAWVTEDDLPLIYVPKVPVEGPAICRGILRCSFCRFQYFASIISTISVCSSARPRDSHLPIFVTGCFVGRRVLPRRVTRLAILLHCAEKIFRHFPAAAVFLHSNFRQRLHEVDPSKSSPQPTGPKRQFDFRPAWDRRGVTLYDRVASSNGKVPFDFCYSIEFNDTRPGRDPSLLIVCDPTIHNNTVA